MRIAAIVFAAALGAGQLAPSARTRTVDFDAGIPGQPPTGFLFARTANIGLPARWEIRAEGSNRFLAQVDADPTRARFPVAVLEDFTAADVDIRVRFRPVSGTIDQAAGIVWRYADENNYYIVRANALEDNVVLYKVEHGKRTDLPLKGEGRTYGRMAEVPAGQWSELGVAATGPLFQVYYNGARLYEVEDTTFSGAGKAGLWTKADSVTDFDDLRVAAK